MYYYTRYIFFYVGTTKQDKKNDITDTYRRSLNE